MKEKLKIGITQGDINSISYEVILKNLAIPEMYEPHAVVLYGSPKVAAYHKKNLDLNVPMSTVASAKDAAYGAVSVINCNDEEVKVDLGQATKTAGLAAFQALERACQDLKDGLIDVLVTGPINKSCIQSDVFQFPGHTEYLEQVFANGKPGLMLMVCDRMRVAVATGHIAVDQIASQLTQDLVMTKAKLLNDSLVYDFAIQKPRIAILALNPHAGDEGLIGKQEQEVLMPAIEALQNEGIYCYGPYPADGFFGSEQYTMFDGVLAMYHDQGLIPFKAMSEGRGVNFTTGLPIVRTSPAHGTAYGLVGQQKADESSFREAFYLAIDVYKNRERYEEMYRNPLRKQHIEQVGDLNDLPPVQED